MEAAVSEQNCSHWVAGPLLAAGSMRSRVITSPAQSDRMTLSRIDSPGPVSSPSHSIDCINNETVVLQWSPVVTAADYYCSYANQ